MIMLAEVNALIRLRGWAGWSGPLLFSYARRHVFARHISHLSWTLTPKAQILSNFNNIIYSYIYGENKRHFQNIISLWQHPWNYVHFARSYLTWNRSYQLLICSSFPISEIQKKKKKKKKKKCDTVYKSHYISVIRSESYRSNTSCFIWKLFVRLFVSTT